MSEENVEILRRSFAAFNSGDWDAALAVADADIEWRLQGGLGFDVPGPVRGKEALKKFWSEFFDIWDAYTMDPVDFLEGPDGKTMVTVHFTAQGQQSSAPIELTYFWIVLLRGGAIVSVDLYPDKGEALEAAGMSE